MALSVRRDSGLEPTGITSESSCSSPSQAESVGYKSFDLTQLFTDLT